MIEIRYLIDNSMNLFQFELFNNINPFFTAPKYLLSVMVSELKTMNFFRK